MDDIFSIKDLGLLHYFLGIEITCMPDGIVLSQKKFTKELLQLCTHDFSRKTATSLSLHLKLQANEVDLFLDPELYRSFVSKLNFLTHTRPDLCYIVQLLSEFMQNPRIPHYKALIHTLGYVSQTAG